jgi:phage shock protein PspC (stress-responsive transcriptional regulator)
MNRTITANIAGIVFHIDENAYEILKKYLDSLRKHFTHAEERDEIIADIEARLAELFREKGGKDDKIIDVSMVEEAIRLMGRPEEFEGEEIPEEQNQPVTGSVKKRVYRNPDDKILGGVCSGIGAYFNVDSLWIRLILLFLFFSWGTGLFLYIILWIIMPEAKTTAEKLEMKGESVNISNIEKSVKEELNGVKNRFGDLKNEMKHGNTGNMLKDGLQKIIYFVGQILQLFLKIFVKVAAAIMIILGLAVFVALLVGFLGVMGVLHMTLPVVISSIAGSTGQEITVVLGIFLLIGIPFLLLLYKGLNILLRHRLKSNIPYYVFLVLWLAGLLMFIISGGSIAGNFRVEEAIREKAPLVAFHSDTLFIKIDNGNDMDEDSEHSDRHTMVFDDIAYKDDKIWRRANLRIVKSVSGNIELLKVQSSHGKDSKDAYEQAKRINYGFSQTDSVLSLQSVFYLSEKSKFRNQKLKLILKLPEGKSVFLGPGMEKILDDVENTNDYEDGKMQAHTWKMTQAGLSCTDCE